MHTGEQIVRQCWERSDGTHTFTALNTPSRQWQELDYFPAMDTAQGDFYFAPLTFSAPRRSNDSAPQRAALLWADLDGEYDGQRMAILPPHHLWETSPGSFQAVWLTEWMDIDRQQRINKSLTYWLNADKGGWFPSKLLRVPETYNWKRAEINSDGLWIPLGMYMEQGEWPEYTVADLEAIVPPVYNGSVSTTPVPNFDPGAFDRNAKYLGKLQQNHVTDRSKRLYTMARWLHKQGVPAEDIYTLLAVQAYNKYQDRPQVLWKMVAGVTA